MKDTIEEMYDSYRDEVKNKMLGIGYLECKKILQEIENEKFTEHKNQTKINYE